MFSLFSHYNTNTDRILYFIGIAVTFMKVSYKKLWKLLIDKDLNKKSLAKIANVSGSTLTKLSKGESVNSEILVRICSALKCELWDIMELLPNSENDENNKNEML